MRIATPALARDFLFAGNATFTIVSERSNTRFTYQLKCKKNKPEILWLSVLTGPDLYKFAGIVTCLPYTNPTQRYFYYKPTRRNRLSQDAASIKAFVWFLGHAQGTDIFHKGLQLWHEGECGRCGRPLTVPSSIATGLGPDCAAAKGIRMVETTQKLEAI